MRESAVLFLLHLPVVSHLSEAHNHGAPIPSAHTLPDFPTTGRVASPSWEGPWRAYECRLCRGLALTAPSSQDYGERTLSCSLLRTPRSHPPSAECALRSPQ